jgi:spermidine/putrescine transport system permease protein
VTLGQVTTANGDSGTISQRERWSILGLAGPAYLWLIVTVFLPLSAMFYFSFLTKTPLLAGDAQLTLKQYAAFFQRDFYQTLTVRSLMLGLYVTAYCILIGYPAALFLARFIEGRSREAILLLVVLPFWSNALVRVFSWTMVLRGGGLLDQAVALVIPGFSSSGLLYTYPAIVIGLVHSFVPYMILTCYLSLQAIDRSLFEAAKTLGASTWQVFRHVTLPLSLPGLVVGSVLIFVPVTGAFMEPRILGGKYGVTLGTVIEDQFTEVFNWPLGAALSFILLGIVLLILALARLVTPQVGTDTRAPA